MFNGSSSHRHNRWTPSLRPLLTRVKRRLQSTLLESKSAFGQNLLARTGVSCVCPSTKHASILGPKAYLRLLSTDQTCDTFTYMQLVLLLALAALSTPLIRAYLGVPTVPPRPPPKINRVILHFEKHGAIPRWLQLYRGRSGVTWQYCAHLPINHQTNPILLQDLRVTT